MLARDGTISDTFKRIFGTKYTYSSQPLTSAQLRLHSALWCAKSYRLFDVVEDNEFHVLMKTGRLETKLFSAKTVVRDIRRVFVNAWKRMAQLFKVSFNHISQHQETHLCTHSGLRVRD